MKWEALMNDRMMARGLPGRSRALRWCALVAAIAFAPAHSARAEAPVYPGEPSGGFMRTEAEA